MTQEMQESLPALMEYKALTPMLKEIAIKIGMVPIFQYSTEVVSKAELD